jgi:hypothetical protein
MTIEVQLYADGVAVRHDWSDFDEGEKVRRFRLNAKPGRSASTTLHTAFSFTERDWECLRATRPKLFAPDPVKRGRAWMRFAQSPEGRLFRDM